MYNEHEKALEAAKVIREYCNSRPNRGCNRCIFYDGGCVMNDIDVPQDWKLTEAERKCNDNGKSN